MMVPYTDDAASGHRSVKLSRRSAEGGVDAVVVFGLELAHQDGDLLLCLVETLLKRREQGDSPLGSSGMLCSSSTWLLSRERTMVASSSRPFLKLRSSIWAGVCGSSDMGFSFYCVDGAGELPVLDLNLDGITGGDMFDAVDDGVAICGIRDGISAAQGLERRERIELCRRQRELAPEAFA